jgi:hypothetical protein
MPFTARRRGGNNQCRRQFHKIRGSNVRVRFVYGQAAVSEELDKLQE